MAEKQMTQLNLNPQKGAALSRLHPWNLQWVIHVDKDATGKPNTYAFDPTDMRIHEFFDEGEPNPKDLEGVEEDKILEIHRAFQQNFKKRDAEREKYYKKIQETKI